MSIYEQEALARLQAAEQLLRSLGGFSDVSDQMILDHGYIHSAFERLEDNAKRISELEAASMDFDEKEMAYLDRQRADADKIARASFALGQLSGMLSNTVDKLRDKGIIQESTAKAGKDEMIAVINRARIND